MEHQQTAEQLHEIEKQYKEALDLQQKLGHITIFEQLHPLIFRAVE